MFYKVNQILHQMSHLKLVMQSKRLQMEAEFQLPEFWDAMESSMSMQRVRQIKKLCARLMGLVGLFDHLQQTRESFGK